MNEMRTTSRKTRVGKVVSDKMDKTIVVIVEDHVAHKGSDRWLFRRRKQRSRRI